MCEDRATVEGHREIVERYARALFDFDFDTMASLQHPDFTEEFPQSNERIKGPENFRKIHENYPGGQPSAELRRLSGSEDQWVLTPTYAPLRITGSGDIYMVEGHGAYPDGSQWFAASVYELKESKVFKVTTYFAPVLEAPEWRAQWVEQIRPEEAR